MVSLDGFDAWVTFLSRRDPGLPLLFGGAALSARLVVAFWLPRRRLTLRPLRRRTRLVLRGERFDRPTDELERLVAALSVRRMTSVLDLWRAVDPDARLASGAVERLAGRCGASHARAAAPPHLPEAGRASSSSPTSPSSPVEGSTISLPRCARRSSTRQRSG